MSSHRAWASATCVAAILAVHVPGAWAGNYFDAGPCQVVSTDPLRYRLNFMVYRTHPTGDMCEIRIEPMSLQGSPPRPIVGYGSPSQLTCTIDPTTGAASFTSNPCVPEPWTFMDSLYVLVEQVPAYFTAILYSTGGGGWNYLEFPCATPVGVEDESLPEALWLGGPTPNPAASATLTRFGLPERTRVRMKVYDLLGRRRRTLVDGSLSAGEHAIPWDLRDDQGREVASGLYLLKLEALGATLTRRVVRTH